MDEQLSMQRPVSSCWWWIRPKIYSKSAIQCWCCVELCTEWSQCSLTILWITAASSVLRITSWRKFNRWARNLSTRWQLSTFTCRAVSISIIRPAMRVKWFKIKFWLKYMVPASTTMRSQSSRSWAKTSNWSTTGRVAITRIRLRMIPNGAITTSHRIKATLAQICNSIH